ncbi:TPM domain-containing protein [Rodentibacter caecimuris]|uniref:TPM domain-containing protein n=1 Tax=Rodentibacter caecimuris TaxID=1796644 RepID=A0ABX3L0A0_9PAST|nr:hypothetical protein BKG89_02675 [Rodentibacter heylii]
MGLFSRIPINKKQIEAAIVRLEQQTSAELRVYIERKLPKSANNLSAMERALQVFTELEMYKTSEQNAVLIYLGYQDHLCAVVGDKGIHQFVEINFWQQQCDTMLVFFKKEDYTGGIICAIDDIAKVLATYFPVKPDDQNELDDEVIIND